MKKGTGSYAHRKRWSAQREVIRHGQCHKPSGQGAKVVVQPGDRCPYFDGEPVENCKIAVYCENCVHPQELQRRAYNELL